MPEFSLLPGNAATTVYVTDTGAVFTNTGPGTVYYANGKVSPTSFDGTLTTGQSVTLYGSPHFTVDRTGFRADMEYVPLPVVVGASNAATVNANAEDAAFSPARVASTS